MNNMKITGLTLPVACHTYARGIASATEDSDFDYNINLSMMDSAIGWMKLWNNYPSKNTLKSILTK